MLGEPIVIPWALPSLQGFGTRCVSMELSSKPPPSLNRNFSANNDTALWRDDSKLQARQPGQSSKPAIDIYSLAGKKLRSVPWDKGQVKGLGWSEDESLLVVTADGNVRCYDLQGDFNNFSLGHGADNYGVESCR